MTATVCNDWVIQCFNVVWLKLSDRLGTILWKIWFFLFFLVEDVSKYFWRILWNFEQKKAKLFLDDPPTPAFNSSNFSPFSCVIYLWAPCFLTRALTCCCDPAPLQLTPHSALFWHSQTHPQPPPPPSPLTPQISRLILSQAKDHRSATATGNHLFRLSASASELRYPLNCNGLIGWIYRGTACQLSLNGIRLNGMKMNSPCLHRLLEMSTRIDRGPRLPAEMGLYALGIACMCILWL